MDTETCDVLVIGSGGAGVRAAIAARAHGASVLLVAKTLEGKAHTVMAEGGINASFGYRDPSDTWEEHFRDTVEEGVFLNNQAMAEILARDVPERVRDLERYGAVFDRTPEGTIAQRPFGGQSHPRTCYVGDTTGHEMIMTLVQEARRLGIAYRPEVCITALVPDEHNERRVAGAFGIDLKTGRYLLFSAKAIILATGGAGRVFKITSNPQEATGDGYAMALRLGARLQDMEQTQFHPTGMVYPDAARGVLVTEAVRGEGGYLINSEGRRFMADYNPEQMELSPRDQTARANYLEIQAGRGSPRGGVYLDISHKGEAFIKERLPRMVKQFSQFANQDITKTPMEVAPTAHHFMGGLAVDPVKCESRDIACLYACGEAAGGVHGANRLGGNALAETQVFGRLAGEAAGRQARMLAHATPSPEAIAAERARLEAPFFQEGASPQSARRRIGEIMWDHAGIVRSEPLLRAGLEKIAALAREPLHVHGSRRYNLEWNDWIEVQNMVLVCEAVIRSALAREESRGAHFRSDHPARDDTRGLVNIFVSSGPEGMSLSAEPVVITRLLPTKRRGD
ncbi:MAG: FAD-binding protein [Candidatus Methanofastidiosa archaeon]|nr:FAD-binding protein [Candidatus Methanofastidiosa archaeon]